MKYLKTFESFSSINEEEGFFDTISNVVKKVKKGLLGDVVEDNLQLILALKFPATAESEPSQEEINKSWNEMLDVADQIKSEKDMSKKNELLKELIGDWDDKNVRSKLTRIGVKVNELRDELGCMTPEEKESYDNRPGGSTGWEGSTGISL